METIARHVVVTGRVTGVGFRYAALLQAARLADLEGYVRNLDAGTVECVVQGAPAAVQSMIVWLRLGPPGTQVDRCVVTEIPVTAKLGSFRIR